MEFVKIFLTVVVGVLLIKYVILPNIKKLQWEDAPDTDPDKIPDSYFIITKEEYPSFIENEDVKIDFGFVYEIDFGVLRESKITYRDGRRYWVTFRLHIDGDKCDRELKAAWKAYTKYHKER